MFTSVYEGREAIGLLGVVMLHWWWLKILGCRWIDVLDRRRVIGSDDGCVRANGFYILFCSLRLVARHVLYVGIAALDRWIWRV